MHRTPDPAVWDDEALRSPHEHADKATRVRRMFSAIAPTYEQVNRLFSAGRDAHWRRRAVALARVRADDCVLDVACGTGDFLRAFAAAVPPPRRLVGCDFARAMLERAVRRGPGYARWCEGDALRLPFADDSFTIVTCAFGVRNFQVLEDGLREFHRVLRPGGRAVILEFTRPGHPLVRTLYEVYARRIMPRGAAWLSGDRHGAYRYLPESVVSFPGATEMTARLHASGFAEVRCRPLTFGIVTVYVAVREDHG